MSTTLQKEKMANKMESFRKIAKEGLDHGNLTEG
jgi:hypothetical protein